jgi:hypothetical protein
MITDLSVADPHYFDGACHFDADPDPACHFNPDPDPTFHFDPDPYPSFQIKVEIGLYSIHYGFLSANRCVPGSGPSLSL